MLIPLRVRVVSVYGRFLDWVFCILGALWCLPILSIEILRVISNFSYEGLIFILCALAVAVLTWLVAVSRRSLREIEDLYDTIIGMGSIHIQEYRPNDILDQSILTPLLQSYPPHKKIRFFNILSRAGLGEICPLVAYNIQAVGLYILSPFEKGQINTVTTFYILHEIGHGEGVNVAQLERHSLAQCAIISTIIWVVFTLDYNNVGIWTGLLGILSVSVLVSLRVDFDFDVLRARQDAEILADAFALHAMSLNDTSKSGISWEDEVHRTERISSELSKFGSDILPRDARLSGEGDARRRKIFQRNLEFVRQGRFFYIPLIMVTPPILALLSIVLSFFVALSPRVDIFAYQFLIFFSIFILLSIRGLVICLQRTARQKVRVDELLKRAGSSEVE